MNRSTYAAIAVAASILALPIIVQVANHRAHAAPRVGSSLDAATVSPTGEFVRLGFTTPHPATNAFLDMIATSPPAALPIEMPLTGPTNEPEFTFTKFDTKVSDTNATFMILTESHYPVFEIRVASTNYDSWTNFDTYPKTFTFLRTNGNVITLTMLEGGVLTNLVFHERPVVRCDGTNWLVDLDPTAKPVRDDTNATNAIAGAAFASGFSQGIRYSLLAATRNPDVHDARILAMIAVELWKKGNP